MRILIFVLIAVCFAAAYSGGCKKKEADQIRQTPQSQSSEEPTKRKQPTITSISDNPAFFSTTAISPKAPEVKDLDNLLRPVLTKLFGEVKLVEESKAPQTKIDGEVVENRMVYVVRLLLTPEEGDNLHSALKGVGFVSSPRLGSKPTHSRTTAVMSLMRSTSLRGYSLVINVDAGRQRIEIESYKLGSKYDRLM
jgi:hypothetical protein